MSSSVLWSLRLPGTFEPLYRGRSESEKLVFKINESIVWNKIYPMKLVTWLFIQCHTYYRVECRFLFLKPTHRESGWTYTAIHSKIIFLCIFWSSFLPTQFLPLTSALWIPASVRGVTTFPSGSFPPLDLFKCNLSLHFSGGIASFKSSAGWELLQPVILALPAFCLQADVTVIESSWSGRSVFLSVWCVLLQAAVKIWIYLQWKDWGQS